MPAARRLDRILQRRGRRGVAEAGARGVPQCGVAHSRAGGDLAISPVDRHPQGNHGRAHVSHHHPGPRARDARPGEIEIAMRAFAIAAALVAFSVLAADAAGARTGKRQLWGSIAYDIKTGSYGFAVDRKTKRDAETDAFRQCGS